MSRYNTANAEQPVENDQPSVPTDATETPNDAKLVDDAVVASASDNNALAHSVEGVTTRQDALDLGVPMLAGDPKEPTGPEDAFGGMTRGDYSRRIGDSDYHPHTTELIEDPEPGGPTVRLVAQRPIAEMQGEVAGVKGGVHPDTFVDAATGKLAK